MPRTMVWLPTVIRVAIAPVLVGAVVLVVESPRSASDVATAAGLVLLGAIHVLYWWRPWPSLQRRAASALAGMVTISVVLLNLLGLAEPLLWLYPALHAHLFRMVAGQVESNEGVDAAAEYIRRGVSDLH